MSNKSSQLPRDQLVEQAFLSGRQVGAAAVFFHQAVADHYGISANDSRYASLIRDQGPLTAGALAKISGLTTGAVTGIIDRLEAVKLVKRVPSDHDRRQVLVETSDERLAETQKLFEGLATKTQALLADYSEHDLVLIISFNVRSAKIMQEEVEQLRQSRTKVTKGGFKL